MLDDIHASADLGLHTSQQGRQLVQRPQEYPTTLMGTNCRKDKLSHAKPELTRQMLKRLKNLTKSARPIQNVPSSTVESFTSSFSAGLLHEHNLE